MREQPQLSPILIGISSCLLGEKVRFDGNHKHDRYITDTLGQYFEYVPVCPEVAVGMGIPRPPIRLEGDPEQPRVVGVKDRSFDVTDELERFSREQVPKLPEISGYILKSKSPSCGMERVKVYAQSGGLTGQGSGIFARTLMQARPELPIEEEGRLGDPGLRDNFLERVFVFRRWQNLVASGLTRQKVIDFHTRHKLSLMAHGHENYQRLGQMVGAIADRPLDQFARDYILALMGALTHRATNRRQANVLQHLMGYLKTHLDSEDKSELRDVIDAYRLGRIPLLAPITLLRHHFRKHPHPWVDQQVYLRPEPAENLLRRGGP
jgi:uncharacterized protein YbgA (DUF1722 family)/uncharacterized protein YbbK (DUF523 family)